MVSETTCLVRLSYYQQERLYLIVNQILFCQIFTTKFLILVSVINAIEWTLVLLMFMLLEFRATRLFNGCVFTDLQPIAFAEDRVILAEVSVKASESLGSSS